MNPIDFLKNFQNIQAKMGDMQEKIKAIQVTGLAGGDMVKIDMNGQFVVTNVSISPEAVDVNDLCLLEDLILSAFSDAIIKAKEAMQQKMSELTGGINLPPGFMGM